MKKIKVIDPETGKEKTVQVNDKYKKEQYSKSTKFVLFLIILILVVPVIVSAISYLVR